MPKSRNQMIEEILDCVDDWDIKQLIIYAKENVEEWLKRLDYNDLKEEWKHATGRD